MGMFQKRERIRLERNHHRLILLNDTRLNDNSTLRQFEPLAVVAFRNLTDPCLFLN